MKYFNVIIKIDGEKQGYSTYPMTETDAENHINDIYDSIILARRDMGDRIVHEVSYSWFDKIPGVRRKFHPKALFLKLFETERRTRTKVVKSIYSFEIVETNNAAV